MSAPHTLLAARAITLRQVSAPHHVRPCPPWPHRHRRMPVTLWAIKLTDDSLLGDHITYPTDDADSGMSTVWTYASRGAAIDDATAYGGDPQLISHAHSRQLCGLRLFLRRTAFTIVATAAVAAAVRNASGGMR